MKKIFVLLACVLLSMASKAQMSSITFTQNVEVAPGDFSFYLMGHNTPPPACAVTDATTNYGAMFGLPSMVTASGAAWKGAGAGWISRIFLMNNRTGGTFDHPFCMISPGSYPITFSDGSVYTISFSFTGPTDLVVDLN